MHLLDQLALLVNHQVSLEEAKLLHRQAKELDALRSRCTTTHDEALVVQVSCVGPKHARL